MNTTMAKTTRASPPQNTHCMNGATALISSPISFTQAGGGLGGLGARKANCRVRSASMCAWARASASPPALAPATPDAEAMSAPDLR